AHEVAVFVALQLETTAIDQKLGAFLDAEIDIVPHFVEVRLGHKRPVVSLWIAGRANLEAFDAWDEFFDQNVGRLFADRNGDRNRHATLAGRAVACTDKSVDGLIYIGVRHHNHMVFRAAETLDTFAVSTTG